MPSPSRTTLLSSRPLKVALWCLGIAFGLLAGVVVALLVVSPVEPTWVLILFVVVAASYATAGLVAWQRRPSNRMGRLMTAGGFAWLLAAMLNTGVTPLVAVGAVVATVPVAVIVHLLHAFPSGRLRGRASTATVGSAYVITVLLQAPQYLFAVSPGPDGVLAVADRPDLVMAGRWVQAVLGSSVMIATTVILLVRLRAADRRQRRVLGPLFTYGVLAVLFVSFSANVLEKMLGMDPLVRVVLQLTALGGIPIAFALGVLRGGFARTGEIEELGAWLGAEGSGRSALTQALAATLGDPSLTLVFWVPERGSYVDEHGRPVELPATGTRRGVAEVDLAGRRVGAIVYDATLIADAETVRTAGRVVAIAVDHERLSAEVLASREALRGSRARIVAAADDERRRIAQDLHDGIQVRLVILALQAYALGDDPTATPSVRRAAAQLRVGLDDAAAELRRQVHGVMPALLIERGLYAATEDLVDRLPVPVELALDGDDQGLPLGVQSTAYFAIAEGLTNAVKHAGANQLKVQLDRTPSSLQISISDDGVGGAVAGGGLGLRGIADRVDVLGGRVAVESAPAAGTRLLVEVPCES